MQVIINNSSLKLIAVGGVKILFNRLPLLVGQDKEKKMSPIDLTGLGHTSKNKHAVPWLVTCTNTRTSYIILEDEALSSSYIYEKLHLYNRDLSKEVARAIVKILVAEPNKS